MNIANFITTLRILLIPILISVFYLPTPSATKYTAVIFFLAAITDGLDGYLARYMSQVSPIGTWLDPIADKLLIVSTLILLIANGHYPGLVIPSMITICREIIISALREWMANIGHRPALQVSWLGKLKTVIQIGALMFLLLGYTHEKESIIRQIGYQLFYIATLLTLISLTDYMHKAWRILKITSKAN